LEEVPIKKSNRKVKVGSQLNGELKTQLMAFLHNNIDVFVWSYEDMSGIDPSIMVHKLNVDPNYQPIKQKE
jgi:hypothetical protein